MKIINPWRTIATLRGTNAALAEDNARLTEEVDDTKRDYVW